MGVTMRRYIVGVLICAFAISFMSFGVARGYAQSDPCQHWATGVLPPFPVGFGPWNCYLIEFVGYTCGWYGCPPPDPPPCKECNAGSPIDLLTGNTFIEETDVKLPGLGGGITLTRTWNSKWPALAGERPGAFGTYWTSTYEEAIFRDNNNYMRYVRADGSVWAFGGFSSLYLVAPSNIIATL